MNNIDNQRRPTRNELLQARSSAAGFSAMAFIGCVIYLAVRSNQLAQLVSVRGILLLLIGTLVCAFILGYLLLFCRLWVSHFTTQWLDSREQSSGYRSPTGELTAQRLLSILGTALMVAQLVLIYLLTRWVFNLLF